jgi:predicted nucleic acid-binding protein
MPLNAIVDSAVLVSAFLFPGSTPGQILKLAGEGAFSMHLSPIPIEETRRSLSNERLRKAYGHDASIVSSWCTGLERMATVFRGPLPDIGHACRDPNDDHVTASAVFLCADAMRRPEFSDDGRATSRGTMPP